MDLMEGKCVRLVQGDFNAKTEYRVDPVELAKEFMDAGLDLLHVVDLDGARAGKPMNLHTVELVAATDIQIQLGGGLRAADDIRKAVDSGADRIVLGSSLFDSGESLWERLTDLPGIFMAGIDARDGNVAIHGWKSTTTVPDTELVSRVESMGRFQGVIYTDISRDGTLAGPNVDRLTRFAETTTLPVIASGGIGSLEDILAVKKTVNMGVEGAIVGRGFYDGKITLEEMTRC